MNRTILITRFLAIVLGQVLNSFMTVRFVSLPLHSVMETAGGVIAVVISMIFFIKFRERRF